MDAVDPKRIVQLIDSDRDEFSLLAIKIIGNICSNSNSFTKDFADCRCIPSLKKIIVGKKEGLMVKEACWTLSNMATDAECVEDLLEVAGTLVWAVKSWEEYEVKREATWVLANACYEANFEELLVLAKEGVFDAFVIMMSERDCEILVQVLKAVDKALDAGTFKKKNELAREWEKVGGVAKLEELQLTKNSDIYCLVIKILEKHYISDDLFSHDSS